MLALSQSVGSRKSYERAVDRMGWCEECELSALTSYPSGMLNTLSRMIKDNFVCGTFLIESASCAHPILTRRVTLEASWRSAAR